MIKSTKGRLFVLLTLKYRIKSTKMVLFVLLMRKINFKSTKSCDSVLLSIMWIHMLFSLHCCVVAVAAERFVDVCFAKNHEFVAL